MYDPFADTITEDARAEAERFRANARSQLDVATAPMNLSQWQASRDERARLAQLLDAPKPDTV